MQALLSPEEVHGGGERQAGGGRYLGECAALLFHVFQVICIWQLISRGGIAFCLSDVREFVDPSGRFSWGVIKKYFWLATSFSR